MFLVSHLDEIKEQRNLVCVVFDSVLIAHHNIIWPKPLRYKRSDIGKLVDILLC